MRVLWSEPAWRGLGATHGKQGSCAAVAQEVPLPAASITVATGSRNPEWRGRHPRLGRVQLGELLASAPTHAPPLHHPSCSRTLSGKAGENAHVHSDGIILHHPHTSVGRLRRVLLRRGGGRVGGQPRHLGARRRHCTVLAAPAGSCAPVQPRTIRPRSWPAPMATRPCPRPCLPLWPPAPAPPHLRLLGQPEGEGVVLGGGLALLIQLQLCAWVGRAATCTR